MWHCFLQMLSGTRMQCWRSNSQEHPRCKTCADTCSWCFFGFGEGSTGHAHGMQRSLFTRGALCAIDLLSRPEATKNKQASSFCSLSVEWVKCGGAGAAAGSRGAQHTLDPRRSGSAAVPAGGPPSRRRRAGTARCTRTGPVGGLPARAPF